jgi:hypothetical protein
MVKSRKELVLDTLASLRRKKKEKYEVTELAEMICGVIRVVEQRQFDLAGKPYRPINSSTLLRPKGIYRPLIDAFLVEEKIRAGDLDAAIKDPVAKRALLSKSLEIANLEAKLISAHKKIQSLGKSQVSTDLPRMSGQVLVDGLGEAAGVLFDALIHTGLFKFDERTGDVLVIARSRKVLINGREIAAFLNWRLTQGSES